MDENFAADNGRSPRRWGAFGGLSLNHSTPHQPERDAMPKTLSERFREVTAIPDQLDRVSQDITKLLVSVTILALLAIAFSVIAMGVASRGN